MPKITIQYSFTHGCYFVLGDGTPISGHATYEQAATLAFSNQPAPNVAEFSLDRRARPRHDGFGTRADFSFNERRNA